MAKQDPGKQIKYPQEQSSPNLPALVKRFVGWLTALLGLISTIVAFIKAVQGSQEIYVAVALVVGFIFVWGSFGYVFHRKRIEEPKLLGSTSRSVPYYKDGYRRLALFGIILWGLLGIGFSAWYIQANYFPEQSVYVVLVADFDEPNEPYKITEIILAQLRDATREYPDIDIAALKERITEREGGRALARSKGEEIGASIVLWGWYGAPKDTAWLTVHFELLEERGKEILQEEKRSEHVAVAELESFRVQTRFAKEMGQLTALALGMVRYEARDYDAALELFSEGLDQYDELSSLVHPIALPFYRGAAYYYKGEYGLAVQDYDRVLELDPNYATAYNNRGTAYGLRGEYDQAIADFNHALELDPNYAIAYYNRGATYLSLGDTIIAQVDLERHKQYSVQLWRVVA